MKLLVDENLAPRLAEDLADLFPGSVHVTSVGLGSSPDAAIWSYAAAQGLSLLTKDTDFANLSLTWGAPPKVVLLQIDNCSTSEIEHLIRSNAVRFSEFERDSGRALLVLRHAGRGGLFSGSPQSRAVVHHQDAGPKTREIWNSENHDLWKWALDRYWLFVDASNRALEEEMARLDAEFVRLMDPQAWYKFLLEKYFPWKFVPRNRGARWLKEYEANNELQALHAVKDRLFAANKDDIRQCLIEAKSIKGLGTAGASGLLAVLFPEHFGTVDQFVVKALADIPELEERALIAAMNPESLKLGDGVILIRIMRRKAEELNTTFSTTEWTPRKVDMVLWTCAR